MFYVAKELGALRFSAFLVQSAHYVNQAFSQPAFSGDAGEEHSWLHEALQNGLIRLVEGAPEEECVWSVQTGPDEQSLAVSGDYIVRIPTGELYVCMGPLWELLTTPLQGLDGSSEEEGPSTIRAGSPEELGIVDPVPGRTYGMVIDEPGDKASSSGLGSHFRERLVDVPEAGTIDLFGTAAEQEATLVVAKERGVLEDIVKRATEEVRSGRVTDYGAFVEQLKADLEAASKLLTLTQSPMQKDDNQVDSWIERMQAVLKLDSPDTDWSALFAEAERICKEITDAGLRHGVDLVAVWQKLERKALSSKQAPTRLLGEYHAEGIASNLLNGSRHEPWPPMEKAMSVVESARSAQAFKDGALSTVDWVQLWEDLSWAKYILLDKVPEDFPELAEMVLVEAIKSLTPTYGGVEEAARKGAIQVQTRGILGAVNDHYRTGLNRDDVNWERLRAGMAWALTIDPTARNPIHAEINARANVYQKLNNPEPAKGFYDGCTKLDREMDELLEIPINDARNTVIRPTGIVALPEEWLRLSKDDQAHFKRTLKEVLAVESDAEVRQMICLDMLEYVRKKLIADLPPEVFSWDDIRVHMEYARQAMTERPADFDELERQVLAHCDK